MSKFFCPHCSIKLEISNEDLNYFRQKDIIKCPECENQFSLNKILYKEKRIHITHIIIAVLIVMLLNISAITFIIYFTLKEKSETQYKDGYEAGWYRGYNDCENHIKEERKNLEKLYKF
jgi:hypothetical protein